MLTTSNSLRHVWRLIRGFPADMVKYPHDAEQGSPEQGREQDLLVRPRKKVVFLGTPAVARRALEILLEAEQTVQVVLVVSQPPARAPRGGGDVPSPVHALALERGIPVLTPESAREDSFLSDLESLAPDLCVTAAYGNVLPDRFLAAPRFGTLNIHPSLLPAYRGAAPVQRAIEEGVAVTGVSVAFTVKAMDAGPIAAQVRVPVDPNVKAPVLLAQLFEIGAETLVDLMPAVFDGSLVSREQDSAQATKARKMSVDEGVLRWGENAKTLHNRVRAFASWPGTRARFLVSGLEQEFKIITTRLGPCDSEERAAPTMPELRQDENDNVSRCVLRGDALRVVCDDGSSLDVVELQPPGKRVLTAREFWNGLPTKDLRRI